MLTMRVKICFQLRLFITNAIESIFKSISHLPSSSITWKYSSICTWLNLMSRNIPILSEEKKNLHGKIFGFYYFVFPCTWHENLKILSHWGCVQMIQTVHVLVCTWYFDVCCTVDFARHVFCDTLVYSLVHVDCVSNVQSPMIVVFSSNL